MRIILVLLGLFSHFCLVRAQSIGVNNDGSAPSSSAMLDVKSINKGLLIPRVALIATNENTPITSPSESLLIYNTATTSVGNNVSPGYYYWSGSAWLRLTTNDNSQLSGWLLGGNAGTSSAIDFIGTTDSVDLRFRLSNISAGVLSNNGNVFWGLRSGNNNTSGYSNIALGTDALKNNTDRSNLLAIGDSALFNNGIGALNVSSGTGNVAIGSKSLFSNTRGRNNTANGYESLYSNTTAERNIANGYQSLYSNTTGNQNTANGYRALYNNTTGASNTANGFESLYSNTTGFFNTANGFWSLYSNTIGDYNTANGYQSLNFNTTGNHNTANGYRALYNNTTGHSNTATGRLTLTSNITGSYNSSIGFAADVATGDLSNATAIGAYAQVACSNCLVLGSIAGVNIATSNVNVGIGINNPGFPLNFGSSLGDKISLWGNAGAHYGLGVQSGVLQIHSDVLGSSIAFGYGSSTTLTSFTENMRIQGNGNLQVRGSITANSSFYTSDSRYKTKIEPIGNAMKKITQLNGYHYYWKDDQNDPSLQTGVLAQEVEKVFPELVKKNEKGYLSVNYSGLIPVLIESTKEQQQQIITQQNLNTNQQNLINDQQRQIEELKNELQQLKKLVEQSIKK